jgi:hypothetical protein
VGDEPPAHGGVPLGLFGVVADHEPFGAHPARAGAASADGAAGADRDLVYRVDMTA